MTEQESNGSDEEGLAPADEAVEYPVDGVLDLHQFRAADAQALVGDYLDACSREGVLDVRIIHGKGTGTLRNAVHSVLRKRADVEGFRLASDSSGWGATIVRLTPDRARVGVVAALLAGCVLAAGCGPADEAPVPEPAAETTGERVALGEGEPEVFSLLGKPLHRPALPAERRQQLEDNLAAARAGVEAAPGNEDAIIWYGRRLAYLSRYRNAIEAYSNGLETHPDSYKLLRHRGHRYVTVRDFERAIADLLRAAELVADVEPEIEPDGIPNRLNQPLSNGHFNIWYHLGLAHYLSGDFESARDAYLECMRYSDNNDLLVATSDWLYMTYRRLGDEDAAAALLQPITADMEIVENDSYYRRLLMYKGEVPPEELLGLRSEADPDIALDMATQGYGVGNWYLVNGDEARARNIFERILEGTSWAAFGYIAAEADLARWNAR